MSSFYLDSSAVVKRYLTEIGSAWVRNLTNPAAAHTITLAKITQVEVATALAARHRAGGISRKERDDAVDLLAEHCEIEYRLTGTTRSILDRAVALTQRHRLRGYDAVQLATALEVNRSLLRAGLQGLIFVAADADLVSAARGEGLLADDPNSHP